MMGEMGLQNGGSEVHLLKALIKDLEEELKIKGNYINSHYFLLENMV